MPIGNHRTKQEEEGQLKVYCMNCGTDINYPSETKTDVCLNQLNKKLLKLFLFNSKNNNLEEKGLTATSPLQEISHTIQDTRGNS